jgi:hypothetical protein
MSTMSLSMVLALPALGAGCAGVNQFDSAFVGERWPPVASAAVVADAPPDSQALETMPIYQSGIQNRGTFSTYVFVPANKSMWRYFARYYRSNALGGTFDGYVGLPAVAPAPAAVTSPR